MPIKQIGSSDPKYLAATDILIGDMSDTNYEFLLFDRPIILLANEWLRENFPDIGIKTDLNGLEDAIKRSSENPDEFKKERLYWLKKTIHQPDGNSSKRVLAGIIDKSGMKNPRFLFIHGNNSVKRNTLLPLYEEAKREGFKAKEIVQGPVKDRNDAIIYIAANNKDIGFHGGFKVHLDHGVKGEGVLILEREIRHYQKNNYFPTVDLHVTEGETSFETTKILVGSYKDRVAMVGYPKSDHLLKFNTMRNKMSVYNKLGFDLDKPLVTYAPANQQAEGKPGGSLSEEVIEKLKEISQKSDYNILVKLKYPGASFPVRLLVRSKRLIAGILRATWPE